MVLTEKADEGGRTVYKHGTTIRVSRSGDRRSKINYYLKIAFFQHGHTSNTEEIIDQLSLSSQFCQFLMFYSRNAFF